MSRTLNLVNLWSRFLGRKSPFLEDDPNDSSSHSHRKNFDPQDDPGYWSQPSRLVRDTCRATLQEVMIAPYAGYEDQDTGESNTIQTLYEWCNRFSVPVKARVLDYGCGGGRLALIWQAMSRTRFLEHTIYLLDHAPEAVRIAWTRLSWIPEYAQSTSSETITRWTGYQDRVLVGGHEVLSNHVGFFEVIYTHNVLQHNSGWKQDLVLHAFHRALKPEGILFLWNEKTFSSWEDPQVFKPKDPLPPKPFYADDRKSAGTAAWWTYRVASHGFELLEYTRSSYTFRKMGF